MLFLLADFDLIKTVEHFVEIGGVYVIFGLLFTCGLGLPLPEDVPLIIGGYFAANGQMHLVALAIASWLGIIGGDCMLYYLGHRYGLNITRLPLIGKHVTESRIKSAEQLFERYGIWVVAIGRLFAGIRGAMVIAAGTIRYNFVKFIIADSLAAVVSGGLFISLGYWAGQKFGTLHELRKKIEHFERWLLIGAVVLIGGWMLYKWWRKSRHKPSLTDKALEKVVVHADPDKQRLTP